MTFSNSDVDGKDIAPSSVSTDALTINDRLIYVYAKSGDMVQTIDPSNTSTPVQDAVAVTDRAKIVLPPGRVKDSGPILSGGDHDVSIVGHGIDSRDNDDGSVIEITSTSNPGINIDSNTDGVNLDGFVLEGQGTSSQTQPAIIVDGNSGGEINDWTIGRLMIRDWRNWGLAFKGSPGFFQCVFNWLSFIRVDPGDKSIGGEKAVFYAEKIGNGVTIEHMNIYPVNDGSGDDDLRAVTIDNANGAKMGSINIGLEVARIGEISNSQLTIDYINYEPSTQLGTPSNHLLMRGTGKQTIRNIQFATKANANKGVVLDDLATADIGPIDNFGTIVAKMQVREVFGSPLGPVETDVSISDIDVQATGNEAVWSRSDSRFADPVDSFDDVSISAGGSTTVSIDNLTNAAVEPLSPSDLWIQLKSRADSSQNSGYSVDKVWYDDVAGYWKADISETEGATSITVDIEVQRRV